MHNLATSVKIRLIKAAQVAGTSDVDTDVIDMANYDGVMIFGAAVATANAGNNIKAQQGDADDLSDAADLAGTTITPGADDELCCIDIYRPRKRYVRGLITRGVSSATGIMVAIQYKGRTPPEVNTVTDEIQALVLNSPAPV